LCPRLVRRNPRSLSLQEIPYNVAKDSSGNVKIVVPALNKQFSPEEISAQVLRKLCDDASKFLGETVTKAVITVPGAFSLRRCALRHR